MSQILKLWEKISCHGEKVEKLQSEHQFNLLRSLRELDQLALDQMRSSQNQIRASERCKMIFNGLKPDEKLFSGGEVELVKGCAGALVLSGGRGSRLGGKIPKGMLPLTPAKGKSLFQIFAEKIEIAQEKYGKRFSLAIMTSRENDRQIKRFFSDNSYWGLDQSHVHFFTQDELPLLDADFDPLIADDGFILTAPNGNGGAFKALLKSGVLDKMANQGTEYLVTIPVDNPFADPLNAALIGGVARSCQDPKNAECCAFFKGVEREKCNEKTGIFVSKNDRLGILEYTQLNAQREILSAGRKVKKLGFANTGEFCIPLKFARRLGKIPQSVWPLHLIKKKVAQGDNLLRKKMAFKAELFIFDLLQWTANAQLVEFNRESSFAPLKSTRGPSGFKSIQHALTTSGDEFYR